MKNPVHGQAWQVHYLYRGGWVEKLPDHAQMGRMRDPRDPSASCDMTLTGVLEGDEPCHRTAHSEATTTKTNKVSMPSHGRVLASHKCLFCRDVSALLLLRQ
jgi:hypothetical protein